MGIKLSPDLSVALIFISVLDNTKSEFVNQKFDEKKHDIKQFLARSIGKKIRKIRQIKFIVDSTEHAASRINKIISKIQVMIFKQLFDNKSSTYTYVLASDKGREMQE